MKQVIEKRNDIVFYLKISPSPRRPPQKSKAIVCEGSNEKAIKMLEEAYAGKKIPDPSCDSKVIDENVKLSRKLGISGTPTLVFSDGRVKSGFRKADDLIRLIENREGKQK